MHRTERMHRTGKIKDGENVGRRDYRTRKIKNGKECRTGKIKDG